MMPNPVTKVGDAARNPLQILARFCDRKIWKSGSQMPTPDGLIVTGIQHGDPEPKRKARDNLSGFNRLPALSDPFLHLFNGLRLELFHSVDENRILPPSGPKTCDENKIYTIS